jgi:ribosome-binding protein aMBF1 (putative translation factor)
MPRTVVVFYKDEAGRAPVLEWLQALRRTDRKAYAKCVVRLRRLQELGHELRRPEADFLREAIYELRIKKGRVQYRNAEIERILARKNAFAGTPRGTHMKKRLPMVKTKDALRILDRITGGDNDLKRLIDEEELNAKVARLIYAARTTAGLTQQQLAQRVGTTQPVIARLEDAEYRGHSLTMLQRIAHALHGQLEIHLVAGKRRLKAA